MKTTIIAMVAGSMLIISGAALAAGDPAAGAEKSKGCASCHGAEGNGKVPLAGKESAYLEQQLKDFRSGARSNSMMNMMAAQLSDADIADLAAFFAAQTPN